jgi:hypothetical protein
MPYAYLTDEGERIEQIGQIDMSVSTVLLKSD